MITRSPRRQAFTLVELLVVIAIIGILVGLTVAAVMVFFRKGPEVDNKISNVDQLSISMTNFKNKWGIYPPSRMRLCRTRSLYGTTQYDIESIATIAKMWPSLGSSWTVHWDGGLDTGNNIWDLETDQCLVFFLGGIPGPGPSVQGFSTNKTNPALSGGERLRYFDFNTSRLIVRRIDQITYYDANYPYSSYANNTATWPFPSYLDVYGQQPYAYFSSGARANGYSLLHFSRSLYIGPYYESNQKFQNPDTFQIVSAGADKQFGGGGQWSALDAGLCNEATGDNQANFHPYKLGISGN